jgi:hypothetical protein
VEEENRIQNHYIQGRKRIGYGTVISGTGREPDTEPSHPVEEKNRIQNHHLW